MTSAAQQTARGHAEVKLPKWRHPAFGYLGMLPFLLIIISIWQMHLGIVLLGTFFALALVSMASLWGARSASLLLLLVISYLTYVMATPYSLLANWPHFLQMILSGLVGLLLIGITVRRERARVKASVAEGELLANAEELRQINQMKDRFISMASHELKTPITTIRVQTQFMLRRLTKQKDVGPDKEFFVRSLQRVDEQTARLTTLILDLLDGNRIRGEKIILNRKLHDFNEIIRKVIEDQCLLTERQIVLYGASSPLEISVDVDRFAQVMINVVSNALKYSPEGSPVEVSLCQQGKHALLRVRDYGPGIGKEDLARIFEMFYRTRDAQASCRGGFGLGLGIAKEIVDRHGGRIWCESELGQGSTFCVELPLGSEA